MVYFESETVYKRTVEAGNRYDRVFELRHSAMTVIYIGQHQNLVTVHIYLISGLVKEMYQILSMGKVVFSDSEKISTSHQYEMDVLRGVSKAQALGGVSRMM